MATLDTVDLGPAHAPREESIKAFKEFEHELRKQLIHLRHDHDKHSPESFLSARNLSDHELATFSSDDFILVRVAPTAYGFILLGKLRLPALVALARDETALTDIHFRAFSDGPDQESNFHSFHTRDIDTPTTEGDGHLHTYQSLFPQSEPLEWFDA